MSVGIVPTINHDNVVTIRIHLVFFMSWIFAYAAYYGTAISLYRGNEYSLSPYRPRALADSCKKNMAGKLFFVFASIRVPMYRT